MSKRSLLAPIVLFALAGWPWSGIDTARTTLSIGGWTGPVVRRDTLCAPDTTGRTSPSTTALGLEPATTQADDPAAFAYELVWAKAIRHFYRMPERVTLPLWARFYGGKGGKWDGHSAPGHGLAGYVAFSVDKHGRLSDSAVAGTASPELNASLVTALRDADTSRLLPRADKISPEKRRQMRLRISEWSAERPNVVPLTRITVDAIRVDEGVDLLRPGRPKYPAKAQMARATDSIEVQYVITEDGKVDPATLLVLSGRYRELMLAALNSVVEGTFRAGRIGSCSVPMLVIQRISFTMRRPAS